MLLLAHVAPPTPESITRVGGYRIEHWRHDDIGRVYVKNRRGRIVAQLHEFDANVFRVIPHGPDGVPQVALYTWTGGANSSFDYYIIRLGAKPKCVAAYWKENGGDDDDLRFQSFDGISNSKIVSWYNGMTYHRVRLPLVMVYRGGEFVEATARFRALLRQRAHAALDDLAQIDREPISPDGDGQDQEGKDRHERFRAIEFLGPKIMLGEETNGWAVLKRSVSPSAFRELRTHRSWISRMIEYRKRLVRHPRLSQIPLNWNIPRSLEAPWD